MLHHEWAQSDRMREIHQVGAEWFGVDQPAADAEMIAMLVTLLEEIGLPRSSLQIVLNSLGAPEERIAYRDALVAFYNDHRDKLDGDSLRRLQTNPLRILDSKS